MPARRRGAGPIDSYSFGSISSIGDSVVVGGEMILMIIVVVGLFICCHHIIDIGKGSETILHFHGRRRHTLARGQRLHTYSSVIMMVLWLLLLVSWIHCVGIQGSPVHEMWVNV